MPQGGHSDFAKRGHFKIALTSLAGPLMLRILERKPHAMLDILAPYLRFEAPLQHGLSNPGILSKKIPIGKEPIGILTIPSPKSGRERGENPVFSEKTGFWRRYCMKKTGLWSKGKNYAASQELSA